MKPQKKTPQNPDPSRAQRNRNWALLLALVGFAAIMYVVAIIRLGAL